MGFLGTEVETCPLKVKQNGYLSENFDASVGLKQGDALSPLLFNIYINDLPDIFDEKCAGVSLGNIEFNVLAFADDLVLISRSRDGLQECLNRLDHYCNQWKLRINCDKSKIMILSKSGRRFSYDFTVGGAKLEVVNRYTYLGVTLSASGATTEAKNDLRIKSRKALFKLISLIHNTHLNQLIALKLFDQLIRPIACYGCEYWACPTKKAEISEQIYDDLAQEKTHLQFLRYILGVNKFASNLAVRGELGRYPLFTFINAQLFKFARRLDMGKGGCLVTEAWKEQKSLNNTTSWYNKMHNVFKRFKCEDLLSISPNRFMNELECSYVKFWSESILNRQTNNKLDTYGLFKKVFKFEPYLSFLKDRTKLRFLTKFRISNHELRVETGRYAKPKLPRDERYCQICNTNNVEDEFHFLLKCPAYHDQRSTLFNSLGIIENTAPSDLFVELMSSTQDKVIWALGIYLSECFSKRRFLLKK